MSFKTRVRVVLADDHPIWRTGVRADLGENFQVVGEAGDAKEAVEVIKATEPDLVVCDLNMPEGGGLKVARECGETTNIVMLTVSEAERDLLDAVAAGASGYLVKSTPPDELRTALWKAAQGEPVFSPALASLVLGEIPEDGQGRRRRPAAVGTRTRGPPVRGSRPLLQRDRRGAVHLAEDRREPCAQHPRQAPPETGGRSWCGYALEHGIE